MPAVRFCKLLKLFTEDKSISLLELILELLSPDDELDDFNDKFSGASSVPTFDSIHVSKHYF